MSPTLRSNSSSDIRLWRSLYFAITDQNHTAKFAIGNKSLHIFVSFEIVSILWMKTCTVNGRCPSSHPIERNSSETATTMSPNVVTGVYHWS